MKKVFQYKQLVLTFFFLTALYSCQQKRDDPSNDAVSAINLKRGELVSCGPADKQLGAVEFETSCPGKVKKDFNLAIALLHSFEYEEAEIVFAKVIDQAPECAMAYWGVAMSNYHPLWAPPMQAELEKGAKAIAVAQSIKQKSKRESAFIDAIALFYKDWISTDHHTRSIRFEKAMEKTYTEFPGDKEAAIFYALSLDAAADPADTSFVNQRKAGAILNTLYPGEPNHPGIVHYIIHSYDYPVLAALALPAARKYASIAPSSAHAQHMPSHIFTRLGLWDECIQSNLIATAAAKCYAESAGIKGHWDEELHGMDYLVYAYLQKGDNDLAKQQLNYLKSITDVYPANFKVAYAFAAIPVRYVLENNLWTEAAALEMPTVKLQWTQFPWQESIIHFTRLLGSVHTGKLAAAKAELSKMNNLYDTLVSQKDLYKAAQVQIQMKAGEAWILFKEGKNDEALQLMTLAASMEDKTEKHPVTPGEVIPARELLADLLLQMNKPSKALDAYEADLKNHPNRFNGLYGAGVAAEKFGDKEKANYYYHQLIRVANSKNSNRPEVELAKTAVKR